MAYYNLEPFGPPADNTYAGMITAAVYNVNRKQGTKPFTPDDFLLRKPEVQAADPADLFAAFKRWAEGLNNGNTIDANRQTSR